MGIGGILALARKDTAFILKKGGFEVEITLTTKDGQTTIDITGIATKHHLGIDSEGGTINSKNVHCSINESDLIELSYPVRNAINEVALIGHKISYKDSTGVIKDYKVREVLPDETLGVLVLILGDYRV